MCIEHRRLFGRLFNTEQAEVAENSVTSKDFYPINTTVSDALEGSKKNAPSGVGGGGGEDLDHHCWTFGLEFNSELAQKRRWYSRVSIAAFQAVDQVSIPGQRNRYFFV